MLSRREYSCASRSDLDPLATISSHALSPWARTCRARQSRVGAAPGAGAPCCRKFRARSALAPIPATPLSLEARIAASPLAHLGAVEATARAAPAAPLRHALIVGACGPTGETLLNQLLGGDAYHRVTAVTRLPLPTSTRKLLPHLHAAPDLRDLAGLPAADDAYLVIGEQYSFYRRDEAFHAMPFDALLQTARAVRAGGTRRLAVVAPVAIYSHSSAFRTSLMNTSEYDLFALDFETLALVRPAAPEKFVRHRNWGKRLASFLLRQVHGLMPEAYYPPTSKEIAAVAARVLPAAPSRRRRQMAGVGGGRRIASFRRDPGRDSGGH